MSRPVSPFGHPQGAVVVAERGRTCNRCGKWKTARFFHLLPNGSLDPRCYPCRAETRRQWRAAAREASGSSKRLGPFALVCSACGTGFEARTRLQVRCFVCQAEAERERKRQRNRKAKP